jgi:predicted N-acetyltransferase YhbS
VIETAAGERIQVGLGPSAYREAQGFALKTGENVRVSGYWEDGEFKATELENQTTGQSIVLRALDGRPMWAGQGRGANRNF